MRALVTGAAGFVGSHLCQQLLVQGHDVLAVDKLTPYYDPAVKQQNAATYEQAAPLLAADVCAPAVLGLLPEVDVVFHLAAQPGVRPSWTQFPRYLRENVEVVHGLLEAARRLPAPPRVVLASSSSVYGDAAAYPCAEVDATSPVSPYGVSKLCMERLATAYVDAFRLPVTSLRYFTVYGPRQRPDMAFHRFVEAALDGRSVHVFGDGHQVRQYTYVADVVEATIRAGTRDLPPGTTLNVCGGEPTTVNGVLELLSTLLGAPVPVTRLPAATGDVRRTGGDGARAREVLGWQPSTGLAEGLSRQVAWHRGRPRPMRTVEADAELAAL